MSVNPENLAAYDLFPGPKRLVTARNGARLLITEPGSGHEHLSSRVQVVVDTQNGTELVDLKPTPSKPLSPPNRPQLDRMHFVIVSSSQTRVMNDTEYADWQANSGLKGFWKRLKGSF